MKKHNQLLWETVGEVKEQRSKQGKARVEMVTAETQSLEKWRSEIAKN
jgi:hypothetical protein